MIVTEGRFADDAVGGAAGVASETAGPLVDFWVEETSPFEVAIKAGGVALEGIAVRLVVFCDVLFGASASAGVLTTGRDAVTADARGTVACDELAMTPALSRGSGDGCCERSVSLAGGHRGTATVAITSTATPASIPI